MGRTDSPSRARPFVRSREAPSRQLPVRPFRLFKGKGRATGHVLVLALVLVIVAIALAVCGGVSVLLVPEDQHYVAVVVERVRGLPTNRWLLMCFGAYKGPADRRRRSIAFAWRL